MTPIGVLYGVAIFVLRSRGLLDATEYTNGWILFQTFWIAVAVPAVLFTMFWVINLEGSRKWAERLGFVVLFIFIPAMAILAAIRFIIGR